MTAEPWTSRKLDHVHERLRAAEAVTKRRRFETLLERHEARLRRVAFGVLGDAESRRRRPAGVAPQGVPRAARTASRATHHEAAWLYRIVHRSCLNELRSRRRRPEILRSCPTSLRMRPTTRRSPRSPSPPPSPSCRPTRALSCCSSICRARLRDRRGCAAHSPRHGRVAAQRCALAAPSRVRSPRTPMSEDVEARLERLTAPPVGVDFHVSSGRRSARASGPRAAAAGQRSRSPSRRRS